MSRTIRILTDSGESRDEATFENNRGITRTELGKIKEQKRDVNKKIMTRAILPPRTSERRKWPLCRDPSKEKRDSLVSHVFSSRIHISTRERER